MAHVTICRGGRSAGLERHWRARPRKRAVFYGQVYEWTGATDARGRKVYESCPQLLRARAIAHQEIRVGL